MTIIQTNEIFGPVVALAIFDGSEEEALRLANDLEYDIWIGAFYAVYTGDLDKRPRVVWRIRSGQVDINCYSILSAHNQNVLGWATKRPGLGDFVWPGWISFLFW